MTARLRRQPVSEFTPSPAARMRRRLGAWALAGAVCVFAGCNLFPQPTYDLSQFGSPASPDPLSDPLSSQPSTSAPPTEVQRPLTPQPQETLPEPQPRYAPVPTPVDPAPLEASPVPQRATERPTLPERADAPLTGPSFGPPQVDEDALLQMLVTGPDKRQVGSGTTFRAVLRNTGAAAVGEVTIEVDFDPALQFPGHEEHRVRQSLGMIAPGDEREVALTLNSDQTGKHCARFAAYVEGRETAWKQVCVEYVPRRLQSQLIGPPLRMKGSRAEYTLKLQNVSPQPLTDVTAYIAHDAALIAREGSTGAVASDGRLSWNVGTLRPGEGIQLQVEFECPREAESACVTAGAAGADLPSEELERCLQVIEGGRPLDVQILDTRDPLKMGEQTAYVVSIRNRSLQAVRGVRAAAVIPADCRVLGASALLAGRPIPLAADKNGPLLQFAPLDVLPADQELQLRVDVQYGKPGDAAFEVTVQHAGQQSSLTIAEPTTVNPAANGQ